MSNEYLLDEFRDFLQEIGRIMGMEALEPSEEGLIALKVDSHELEIQCVPATGKLLIFTPVAVLSRDASAEVYKALLGANLFGQQTGGGWFGIADDSEVVIYHYLVDFSPLKPDAEDFVSTLEKIVELADYWQHHLPEICSSEGLDPLAAYRGMSVGIQP